MLETVTLNMNLYTILFGENLQILLCPLDSENKIYLKNSPWGHSYKGKMEYKCEVAVLVCRLELG